MKAALLPDRGVVKIAGDDARGFLHGLVTADILGLAPGAARFCALLTPQGKIIADFLVTEAGPGADSGFFLDAPRAVIAVLVEKLNLYKLRAKVLVADMSDTLGVVAAWGGGGDGVDDAGAANDHSGGLRYPDPRLAALGIRIMLSPQRAADAAARLNATLVDAADYETHRIALGVPRGGVDFGYGDAFPHETDMDQLGGVDFGKGCYVGQEVVSRMEHRGTARTRAMAIRYDATVPQRGAAVTAGARQLGTMGSAAAGRGVALLRLDRLAEAIAEGQPLTADGATLRAVKPDWARFSFPGDSAAKSGGGAAE